MNDDCTSWRDVWLQESRTLVWVAAAMIIAAETWLLRDIPEVRTPLDMLLGAVLTRVRTPRG
jgi:hypothetical protein